MMKNKFKYLSVVTIIMLNIFLVGCNNNSKASEVIVPLIVETTEKDTEIEFKKNLESVKKSIISTEPISIGAMDEIDHFIDENKDKDEVKIGLCNFITENWKNYLESGIENKNLSDRLTTALARIYIDYPNNAEIQKLHSDYTYNLTLKEVTTNAEKSRNLTSSDGMVELMDFKSENGYIVGTIKNNSNNTYRYVGVDINLLDKDGNQVGSTLANIENLEGYKNWKFKAVVAEENVSSFKIISITANK